MVTDPYEAFERDVPPAVREDVLTMLAEATQGAQHECITILDRDRIDAINCRAHGIIEIGGEEYTFQMQDGDWNGTELLAWNEDKPFERHVPTKWALQPTRELIDKALAANNGSFLLLKWDAILRHQPEVAAIPASYAYDRRVQPGCVVERHWREIAAKHHFEIVTQDEANQTRALLAEASQ